MKCQLNIACGCAYFKFDGKPDDSIRAALKASGYRWNPSEDNWWRRGWQGAADLSAWIQKQLNPPACSADTPCWVCKAPGMLRNHGASTPVYCDDCEAKDRAHQHEIRYGKAAQ